MDTIALPELAAASDNLVAPKTLIGTLRRIAGIGPAYEVLQVLDDSRVQILVLESGEIADYLISDALLDPDLGR